MFVINVRRESLTNVISKMKTCYSEIIIIEDEFFLRWLPQHTAKIESITYFKAPD
jgi:hypothetical protein